MEVVRSKHLFDPAVESLDHAVGFFGGGSGARRCSNPLQAELSKASREKAALRRRLDVTVRPDCPAALIQGEIVSASDSGHYGVAGATASCAGVRPRRKNNSLDRFLIRLDLQVMRRMAAVMDGRTVPPYRHPRALLPWTKVFRRFSATLPRRFRGQRFL
jgi:hypothetical protein